jgi:hypothetical protein
MGSCLSKNNIDTTESAKPRAVEASTPVKSVTSNIASITQVQASVPKSNSHPSHPSSSHRHHGHGDTEGMSDTSEEQLRMHPKPPVQQAPSTAVKVTRTSERIPLARVRSGYSSGGSSGENLEPTLSRDKSFDTLLSEWRVELSAEGNLPKSVVRIEVRSTLMWYMLCSSKGLKSHLARPLIDDSYCRLILEGRSKKYMTG